MPNEMLPTSSGRGSVSGCTSGGQIQTDNTSYNGNIPGVYNSPNRLFQAKLSGTSGLRQQNDKLLNPRNSINNRKLFRMHESEQRKILIRETDIPSTREEPRRVHSDEFFNPNFRTLNSQHTSNKRNPQWTSYTQPYSERFNTRKNESTNSPIKSMVNRMIPKREFFGEGSDSSEEEYQKTRNQTLSQFNEELKWLHFIATQHNATEKDNSDFESDSTNSFESLTEQGFDTDLAQYDEFDQVSTDDFNNPSYLQNKLFCLNCGGTGHTAYSCTAKRQVVCCFCETIGHENRECLSLMENALAVTKHQVLNNVEINVDQIRSLDEIYTESKSNTLNPIQENKNDLLLGHSPVKVNAIIETPSDSEFSDEDDDIIELIKIHSLEENLSNTALASVRILNSVEISSENRQKLLGNDTDLVKLTAKPNFEKNKLFKTSLASIREFATDKNSLENKIELKQLRYQRPKDTIPHYHFKKKKRKKKLFSHPIFVKLDLAHSSQTDLCQSRERRLPQPA